jgi:hypothetical protein
VPIKQCDTEKSLRFKSRRTSDASQSQKSQIAHAEADFTTKVSSWQTRINEVTGSNDEVNLKKRSRKTSAPTSPTATIFVDLHVTHRPASSFGVNMTLIG